MLTIHFLNVGHGDSAILEFEEEGQSHFAVVDCFRPPAALSNPVLTKLQSLGADRLSFVALTHPHKDHFFGMSEVLEHFAGRVDNFYTYPIPSEPDRLRKLVEQYAAAASSSDSQSISASKVEFIKILLIARDLPNWESMSGRSLLLIAPGFADISFNTVLPPNGVKGKYFGDIENGILKLEDVKDNALSLAIEINYAGKSIMLGGDGTAKNWQYQNARQPFSVSDVVKIPHHGSKEDCGKQTLDILFGAGNPDQIAVISAGGGKHHPHSSVLQDLIDRGIQPYCTSRSNLCSPSSVRNLIADNDVEPSLLRLINSLAIETAQERSPCQGDISVKILPNGTVSVQRQHQIPCPFRNDFVI